MLLKNRVAVITGSAKGIGAVTAQLLAENGAKVVVNYRYSQKEAILLVDKIQAQYEDAISIKADLTKKTEVQRMVKKTLKKFGRIDIWVNNASEYTQPKRVEETDWSDFQKELDGTLKTTLLCCQSVIPIMRKQKYGRIINIVTTLVTRPASGYSAHATAKSALLGFTRNLAKEVGKDGITVNMVSPGMTITDTNLKVSEKIRNTIADKTPLKRLAIPEDIANAILFYASDLSGFVTGTYLPVDGGLSTPLGI